MNDRMRHLVMEAKEHVIVAYSKVNEVAIWDERAGGILDSGEARQINAAFSALAKADQVLEKLLKE